MGFSLNPKWVFSVHYRFLSNSPIRLSPPLTSVKSGESSFNSARLSFASILFGEDEISLKDPIKACTFSSATPELVENDYVPVGESKIKVEKNQFSNLYYMMNSTHMSIEDDPSTSTKSSQPSRYTLLMENLNALEETFDNSEVLRLEMDNLTQWLKTCLNSSTSTDLLSVPTENDGVLIRSKKKAERKMRRERALLSLKPMQIGLHKPAAFVMKKASDYRTRRLEIANSEVEMSIGVKIVANLENIRTTLEEDSGKVASLSCWAKAAGLSEKVLLQYLHFGWHCRDELLKSTRSLVIFLARNYRGLGLAFEDLLQAGYIGVLQGAERFDHTRGYRFSTYVQFWIRKSMSMTVARHARGIKIPYSLSRAVNQVQKARKTLKSSHGVRYPADEELANFTGLSVAKVRSASECLRVVGSIDQKTGDPIIAKHMEYMADTTISTPEDFVTRRNMKKEIHELLQGLDQREKQVMVFRYGLNNCRRESLEEIGKRFKVSKEWIRKIETKAMTKLRNGDTCQNLSYYLDI